MDVVKPVDSGELLPAIRSATTKKPSSKPQAGGPSPFARMLKQKSRPSERTPNPTPPSTTSPQTHPRPTERDAFAPAQVAEPSSTQQTANSVQHPLESGKDDEAVEPVTLPEAEVSPVVAPEPLRSDDERPGEIELEIAIGQVPFDGPNIAEAPLSEVDFDPVAITQAPNESLEDAELAGADPFPISSQPESVGLETQQAIDGPVLEPAAPVLKLAGEGMPAVAVSPISQAGRAISPPGFGVSGESQGNPGKRFAENENRLHQFSPSSPAFQHSESVSQLSALTPLEMPVSMNEAGPTTAQGLGPAANPPGAEGPLLQAEAAFAGPERQAAPPAQTQQTQPANGQAAEEVRASSAISTNRPEPDATEGLVDRIGTSVLQAAGGGKVLRMRMHPPELGILQIEVASVDGTVTARLDVENARAHRAILENLPQLQEMLNRAHTHIDRIELNIMEPRSGQEGHSGQSGQSASERNSPEPTVPPARLIRNEESDSREDRDSFGKTRQMRDWASRSLPLSGIDIHV